MDALIFSGKWCSLPVCYHTCRACLHTLPPGSQRVVYGARPFVPSSAAAGLRAELQKTLCELQADVDVMTHSRTGTNSFTSS